MTKKAFHINGRVVDRGARQLIAGLRVEAWDKDLIIDDLLGRTVTDEEGRFTFEFTSEYFQELFLDRKPDLFFRLHHHGKKIHSTEKEVIWDYDSSDKEITIAIDFASLPPEKDKNEYTVSGRVTTTANNAVPGLVVEAFDKKISQIISLGKEKTNESGHYLINYTKKAAKILNNGSADLFVQVKKGRKVLAKSSFLINAPKEASINLVVPEAAYLDPSEYEQLDKAVRGFINYDVIGQLKDDDIEYIIVKLKLEPVKVKRYLNAQKLVLAAGEYTTDQNIPPEIFYGILRGDSPPVFEGLVKQSAEGLKQSLKKSLETKGIPFFQNTKIDEYVATLKEIAVEIAERDPDDPDAYSIKRLVENIYNLPGDLRKTFVRHHTLHQGSREAFLKELLEKEPAFNKHIDQITGLFTLSDLTRKNMSLIRAINRDIGDSDVDYSKGIRNLTKMDAGGKDGWKKYLTKNKINIQGKDQDGRPYTVKTYAEELARSFKKEFPMVDFIHSLAKGKMLPEDEKLKNKFLQFFDDNPDFNLAKISIDYYLAESGIEKGFKVERDKIRDKKKKEKVENQQKTFREEIRSWQRVYKLLADDEKRNERAIALREIESEEKTFNLSKETSADKEVNEILVTTIKVRLDPAIKIAGMNKEKFIDLWEVVRKKSGSLEKVELRREGEDIYNRARFIAFMLFASVWDVAAPSDNVR